MNYLIIISKIFIKNSLFWGCLISFSNGFSQTPKDGTEYEKRFKSFCKNLKKTNIQYSLDTTEIGLGVYKVFEDSYFDKVKMKANFRKDTSVYNEKAKFMVVQKFISSLQTYLAKISQENLKIENYTTHGKLTLRSKNNDDEEAKMLLNSIVLFYADSARSVDLMIITFNPANSKIIYITGLGINTENYKYISEKFNLN